MCNWSWQECSAFFVGCEVQGENSLFVQLSVCSNAAARGEALNKLVFALVHTSIYIPNNLRVNFQWINTAEALSALRGGIKSVTRPDTTASSMIISFLIVVYSPMHISLRHQLDSEFPFTRHGETEIAEKPASRRTIESENAKKAEMHECTLQRSQSHRAMQQRRA